MFISRDLLTDIRQWLDREKILILKGSRQVGKTTLLKFLEQELKKEYPTLFFSIDLGNRFYFTLPGGNDSPGSKVQERRTENST
jgi:AAA+ ATPase superfamily predicted ATPase